MITSTHRILQTMLTLLIVTTFHCFFLSPDIEAQGRSRADERHGEHETSNQPGTFSLTFKNETLLTVALYKKDTRNRAKMIKTLAHGQTYRYKSYEQEQWMVKDKYSNTPLLQFAATKSQPKILISPETIRSVESKQKVELIFQNDNNFEVGVFWKDFKGNEKKYAELKAGQSYKQSTYTSHPWIVRNLQTNDIVGLIIANGGLKQTYAFGNTPQKPTNEKPVNTHSDRTTRTTPNFDSKKQPTLNTSGRVTTPNSIANANKPNNNTNNNDTKPNNNTNNNSTKPNNNTNNNDTKPNNNTNNNNTKPNNNTNNNNTKPNNNTNNNNTKPNNNTNSNNTKPNNNTNNNNTKPNNNTNNNDTKPNNNTNNNNTKPNNNTNNNDTKPNNNTNNNDTKPNNNTNNNNTKPNNNTNNNTKPNNNTTKSVEETMEDQILVLINNHRKGLGLGPLQMHPTIQQYARDHSVYMKGKGKISHDNFKPRMNALSKAVGGAFMRGENVAMQNDAQGAFNAWLGSPPHRGNIEQSAYTHTGIGVVARGNGQYYLTHIFIKK